MSLDNQGSTPTQADRNTYVGLFLVALSTLMYEILLTRIFSVTMWYHFAFVAISVAMFGMTVGAIGVYLLPNYFRPERVKHRLAFFSLCYAGAIVLSFLVHLRIHFLQPTSLKGIASLCLTYLLIAVPFVLSGVCVSLALTKFPSQVGELYAADLAGAGLGCVLVIYLLDWTNGPTAVIGVAFVPSLAALFFAAGHGFRQLRAIALACSVLLGVGFVGHSVLVARQQPLFRLEWVKGALEPPPLFEKWNSFSRVTVHGDPNAQGSPFGWGLSANSPRREDVRQLFVTIDSGAGTVLTAFDGNLEALEYLKYDVTNVAHYLRPAGSVLVVGAGGGRDVLSALAFGQKSVLAVEINQDIVDTVNRRFGDFTGHLDRLPNVTFVRDEARSYIARQTGKFDIIQISLIDTWAATAAGAFVLAEHSLYTVEAWKVLLDHLTPRGVLTVSRWYDGEIPLEMYRTTALASVALTHLGTPHPRSQLMIVRHKNPTDSPDAPAGVGTVLVSKAPFSESDVDTIEELCRRMQFDLVLSPRSAVNETFATLGEARDLERFTANFPVNIAPPSDDNPFFFHMLRLKALWSGELWRPGSHLLYNFGALVVLMGLLLVVFALTVVCILVPLALKTGRASLKGSAPWVAYFCSIGLGFMLVEISQMQRLIIFLGHPTYGLSVVLFTLLLSGGLGSFGTRRIGPTDRRAVLGRLGILLIALVLFGQFTPAAIALFQGSTTPVRIAVAVGLLFPLGLLMGMAFPLGMKAASEQSPSLTPWLWGINGATSVCASVLAVAIAMNAGISAAFWTGAASYLAAFLALGWNRRGQRGQQAS